MIPDLMRKKMKIVEPRGTPGIKMSDQGAPKMSVEKILKCEIEDMLSMKIALIV